MLRAILSLLLLLVASSLFAEVAPEAERTEVRRALASAYGRYESVPEALRWKSLVVDGRAYARARIHSADTWAAVIFYDNGIRTVPLEKLPPEAQRLLGYDPENPPPPPPAPKAVPATVPVPAASKPKLAKVLWSGDPVARVLAAYGERPYLRREVDLRPEFERLGLSPKNQGVSSSCSVYAVVAALEYQFGENDRLKDRLSEDFLLWATLRSLGKTKDRLERFGGEARLSDGLATVEVTQALRSYGIPERRTMPASGFDPGADTPPEAAQTDAGERCRVGSVVLSGRSRREQLEQMVLALNEGLPVVVGIDWPKPTLPFYTSGRIPDDAAEFVGGHAVVIVGYSCPDEDIAHTVFRFRNSYGARWGDNGYGTVSWDYLTAHFSHGMFLDVR